MPNEKSKRSCVIGLTGGIGSGKSAVLEIFRSKGAYVLDADKIVRELLMKDRSLLKNIRQKFGAASFSKDGTLDRQKLAMRVFMATKDRKSLERLIHPRVRRVIEAGLKANRKPIAVVDVPLLYESRWENRFDDVVVVTAPKKTRIERLQKRGISQDDAERRMNAQMDLRAKAQKADYVVNNSGSLTKTKKQIDVIWKRLRHTYMEDSHGIAARKTRLG